MGTLILFQVPCQTDFNLIHSYWRSCQTTEPNIENKSYRARQISFYENFPLESLILCFNPAFNDAQKGEGGSGRKKGTQVNKQDINKIKVSCQVHHSLIY